MNVIALYMATTNDTNGNPRRAFVLIDQEGQIQLVVDEGHMGTGALNEYRDKYNIIEGPRFEITPAAYRDLKRHKTFKPS